jgi:hypothetical protein
MSGINPLDQSDEEIMSQSAPPPAEVVEEKAEPVTPEPEPEAEPAPEPEAEVDPEPVVEEDGGEKDPDPADDKIGDTPPASEEDKDGDKAEPKPDEGKAADAEPKADAEDKQPESPTFAVPTEFTANGKTVKLKNESEAISLMQMGANYTKRMQELAPHRKVVMMLQDNELMDEGKLSLLIDASKGNPDAIKQLIKDANIDPLDIDTNDNTTYTSTNHTVTEEQEKFRIAVEDLGSTDSGKETIVAVSTWDQTSKDAVWQSPEIMATIHEQRESGVYSLISDEVDRRMTLGQIPNGTPFLEAYKDVGLEMANEAQAQADNSGSAESGVKTDVGRPAPKVVTTRVAEPKAPAANGDKAAAAAATRAAPATAKTAVNHLSMSDDDFIKQMEGRV